MKTVLGLREYEELHTVSRLDFFASAAATRAFSDELVKLIKKKKEEQREERGRDDPQAGALGIDPDTLRWAVRRSLKRGLKRPRRQSRPLSRSGERRED